MNNSLVVRVPRSRNLYLNLTQRQLVVVRYVTYVPLSSSVFTLPTYFSLPFQRGPKPRSADGRQRLGALSLLSRTSATRSYYLSIDQTPHEVFASTLIR